MMTSVRPDMPRPPGGHGAENYSAATSTPGTLFSFRKRWSQIDWRLLASVDVDRIAREMDVQSLQQNIMNVTFCNIQSEEFQNVDANFVKLFRLSQLVIEYLLHCQQYLSEQTGSLEQKLQEAQQEVESVRSELSARSEELRTVRKENRKRRKVIEAYQDMMNAGATGLHSCPVCSREFVSAEYLKSHIHRRHPDHPSLAKAAEDQEKETGVSPEELEQKLLEQMNERLRATEERLRQEMTRKEEESSETRTREFEDWKSAEEQKLKLEMQAFQEPILSELKAMQEEKEEMEKVLRQKEAELKAARAVKQSHLGHLEGAEELELRQSRSRDRKRREELVQVKQQMESQVEELQSQLRKQEKSWQRKMQKLSTVHQDQLKESLGRMEALERSLQEGPATRPQHQEGGEEGGPQFSREIQLLKQKVQEQEQSLVTQQRQLSVLRASSRDPSPIPPPVASSSVQNGVHSQPVLSSEEELSESEEEEEEGEEEEEEEGEGAVDEVDAPGYTPWPHKPMIRTKYNHRPDVLDNIKRETQGILEDALTQRGLGKATTGLSSSQMEEKMRTLQKERQQRIQAHYNFLDQRERAVAEVEEATRSYVAPKVGVPPLKSRRSPRENVDLAGSLPPGGRTSSKPPKPTGAARLSLSLPVPSGSRTEAAAVATSTAVSHVREAPTGHQQPLPVTRVLPGEGDSDDSDSEQLTSEDDQEEVGEEASQSVQLTPVTELSKTPKGVPTSSDEDSIEELAAQLLSGRASSTPIKAYSHEVQEANPTKVPPARAPVLIRPKRPTMVESISDESLDLSDTHSIHSTHGKEVKSSLLSSTREVKSQKTISRTATSHSALTTVSVEDFDDMDFSDL